MKSLLSFSLALHAWLATPLQLVDQSGLNGFLLIFNGTCHKKVIILYKKSVFYQDLIAIYWN